MVSGSHRCAHIYFTFAEINRKVEPGMKKLLTSILVLALLTGIFPGCTEIYQKAEAASGSYWLYGTRLTKKLGGEKGCHIKMHYNDGKLTIKGGMRKGAKKAGYSKGKKIGNKTRIFETDKKCKVYELESPDIKSYLIGSYIEDREIGADDDWAGISTQIKIVKGKVKEIYLSV